MPAVVVVVAAAAVKVTVIVNNFVVLDPVCRVLNPRWATEERPCIYCCFKCATEQHVEHD